RCDRSPAFVLPASALAADTAPGRPPASLVAALADFGIALGHRARISGDNGEFALTGAGHEFVLTQPDKDEPWQVELFRSLPDVNGFATAGNGDLLAAGGE